MCLMKLGQHGIPYWAPHLPLDKADSPANSLGSLNEGNTTSVNPQKETTAESPFAFVALSQRCLHCYSLQIPANNLPRQSFPIAATWKDTSQVSTAPQVHDVWHSHSKERKHFWHNRIFALWIQDTQLKQTVVDEVENLSCHKTYVIILVPLEPNWKWNILQKQSIQTSSSAQQCIKRVYITGTSLLRLLIVLELRRTSSGSKKRKGCDGSELPRCCYWMPEVSEHHI